MCISACASLSAAVPHVSKKKKDAPFFLLIKQIQKMMKTLLNRNIFEDFQKIFQSRQISGLYLKRWGARAFQREALEPSKEKRYFFSFSMFWCFDRVKCLKHQKLWYSLLICLFGCGLANVGEALFLTQTSRIVHLSPQSVHRSGHLLVLENVHFRLCLPVRGGTTHIKKKTHLSFYW